MIRRSFRVTIGVAGEHCRIVIRFDSRKSTSSVVLKAVRTTGGSKRTRLIARVVNESGVRDAIRHDHSQFGSIAKFITGVGFQLPRIKPQTIYYRPPGFGISTDLPSWILNQIDPPLALEAGPPASYIFPSSRGGGSPCFGIFCLKPDGT